MNDDLTMAALDEILEDSSPAYEVVPLCVSGKAVSAYEEVAARIAERAARAEKLRKAATVDAGADDRLGAGVPAEVRDEEQDEADRLLAAVHAKTIPFRVCAIGPEEWDKLYAKHPPRTDPGTGKRHPEDFEGVNRSTFFPELLRKCLAYPQLDDGRYARVIGKLTKAQRERLYTAATNVNVEDRDVPFWPNGSADPLG